MTISKDIEDLILKEDLSQPYSKIALKYNFTTEQIRYIFRKNNIKKPKVKKTIEDITDSELQYFLNNYNDYSYIYFAQKFNVSYKIIYSLKNKHNLVKDKRIISNPKECSWTQEEISLLLDNRDLENVYNLFPNRSKKSVIKKLWENGFSLNKTIINNSWSQNEIDYITKNVNQLSSEHMAWFLQRSLKGINHKIKELDLIVTEKHISKPELQVKQILDSLNIKYLHDCVLTKDYKFRPDFNIQDKKILIECHGDYWHANPEKYEQESLTNTQKINIEKDLYKKEYYENLGYTLIIFWETDITNDIDYIKNEIIRLLI